jgi:hypothetical protein
MTKADSVHSTPQIAAPSTQETPIEKLARLRDEAARAAGALPALSESLSRASGPPAVLPCPVETEPAGSVESYSDKGATISRRAIMNMMVSAAAMTAAGSATAVADVDPIFAAIENHRRALATFEAALREHGDLDESLPADKTKSSSYAGEITIVETDDPRWIASVRLVDQLSDEEVQAACELVDIRPTTTLGLMRLLRYATDYVEAGQEWPTDLVEDEQAKRGRDWFYFLARSVCKTVSELRWPDTDAVVSA